MRLYLSSFHVGNQPNLLQELVRRGRRAVVITNAHDPWPDTTQNALRHEINDLGKLGLDAVGLDLREFFGNQQRLAAYLSHVDLVWAKGGNSFVLRRAMKQSGFDVVIRGLLEQGQITYGGYSAGAVVATPTLRGIEMCDEPHVVPLGYDADVAWDGLNLVPYSIVPHFQSDHPESHLMGRVVEYFEQRHMPFRTLQDGQAIVVDDRGVEASHPAVT